MAPSPKTTACSPKRIALPGARAAAALTTAHHAAAAVLKFRAPGPACLAQNNWSCKHKRLYTVGTLKWLLKSPAIQAHLWNGGQALADFEYLRRRYDWSK